MRLFITKIAVYLPSGKIEFSNSICATTSAKEAERIASTVFPLVGSSEILETSPVPFELIKTVYEFNFRG